MISAKAVEALDAEAGGPDGHQQIIRLAVNTAAAARGLPEPWPIELPDDTADRVRKLLRDLGDLSTWEVADLGALREELLASADRSAAGAWYTPPPIARSLTRAALSNVTDLRLDDDLADILRVSVLDPACGAGVFLTAAAHELARACASLMFGSQNPPALTIRTVLPTVMQACVYGIDTDPVAVDLAKSACWLAAHGTVPIGFLDDNIVVGNALDGDLPPALTARLNESGPLVIVGNPPYKDKAKGQAPWIEARRPGPRQPRAADELWRPSLDEFRVPGNGRMEYVLSNLHVYFWRWALWRAFESRLSPGTVAFLSPGAWITGPAFAGMRAALRRAADEGWVIDLTPEGKQPPLQTRIFPGVAQPLCAAVFARYGGPNPDQPAHVRWASVTGTQHEKFQQIDRLLHPSAGD